MRVQGLDSAIAEIWTSELAVQSIEMSDNFFDLGGSSVQMLNILFRVQEALLIEVPPAIFFDQPRFGEFCGALAQLLSESSKGTPVDTVV
jgi:acyl carrier protein